MLRVDVNGDDFPADANKNYQVPPTNPYVGVAGDDEIWAYGLRNPWRDCFDRETGDLWIADVGQGTWEEIDFQPPVPAGGPTAVADGEGLHARPRGAHATARRRCRSRSTGTPRGVLDHRRVRVPRVRDAGAGRDVLLRRLLLEPDLIAAVHHGRWADGIDQPHGGAVRLVAG